uniref:Uncharacterized protein n=1 Tax=Glossina brevipalpis TaxID=37001 RepID=A0A1A9WUL0_9MUSC
MKRTDTKAENLNRIKALQDDLDEFEDVEELFHRINNLDTINSTAFAESNIKRLAISLGEMSQYERPFEHMAVLMTLCKIRRQSWYNEFLLLLVMYFIFAADN